MMGFRLFDFYHTLYLLAIFVYVRATELLMCASSQITENKQLRIRTFLGYRNLLRNSLCIMYFYVT